MMWDCGDFWSQGFFGGGWLMFFGLILVTVAAVLLVVFLVRQTAPPTGMGAAMAQAPPTLPLAPESPREILMRRYASGEVDREEYLQRLSDL